MDARPAAAARRPTFASSKFAVPASVKRLVGRPALLERLDGGAGAALTLLVGSPGAGKTSLLVQWAHHQPHGSVAWLNCDGGDADAERFWGGVLVAIDGCRPGFAVECLDLLALNGRVDHDFLESLLMACEALEPPVSLVIDDFQFAGRAVHDHLRLLLARGLGGLRLVVGSRSEPRVGLERLRVGGRLCEVREADLRFSAAEAAVLLGNAGVEVTGEQLGVVVGRTEGWAAGLELAAVALRDVERRDDFVARLDGSVQTIGHYLWSEVFEAQRPAVQRFLLDTSVVEELSPGLAAALSPASGVTLLDVEAANLLVVRLDPAGRAFRYHHLFAEMLRSRLRAVEPDHEFVLHDRAGSWYLEQGDRGAAFRHRWRAGQRTAAMATMHGTVLDAYYDDLLPSFDGGDWSLSDDDLVAAPGPAVSFCTALMTRGHADHADRIGARLERLVVSALAPAELQQLCWVRSFIALILGDTRAVGRPAGEAMALGPQVDPDGHALAATALARARAWEDDAAEAFDLLGTVETERLTRVSRNELAVTRAFGHLFAGDLTAVADVATALSAGLERSGASRADFGVVPQALLATMMLERGEVEEAAKRLAEVDGAASPARLPVRVLTKIGLSRIARVDGDFELAFAILDDARAQLREPVVGSGLLDRIAARQALLLVDSGEPDAAKPYLDTIDAASLRANVKVRRAVALGTLDEARRGLDQLSAIARTRRQHLDLHLARLAVAEAAGDRLDDIAVDVFDVAAPEGFVLPIAEAGIGALDAVRRVTRARPVDAYHAALATARPCAPAPSTVRARWSFEQLSERECTVLRYLATSMTYGEIADQLYVSTNTIKTHAKNVTRKLQASSRAEALSRARELHYL